MSEAPTRLVLLGHPVSQSLSPALQNAALAASGLSLRYEALDVDPGALSATLHELVRERAAGNVTVPHKAVVARTCAELTPQARRVAAVNTFAVRDGALVGHNTDIGGFDQAIRDLVGQTPANCTVGLFGAGGAAAAVLAAVESWTECNVIVANRSAARAAALCERFGTIAHCGDANQIAEEADIVVNATSLGMRFDEHGPIDPVRLRRAAAVLDLVYSPTETRFVRAARAHGVRAADGLSMLVAQGAEAFAWWFGVAPDVEVMWRAVGRTPPVTP